MMIQIESDKILLNIAQREVAVRLTKGYYYIRSINRNTIELVNNNDEWETSINLTDIDDFAWYARV